MTDQKMPSNLLTSISDDSGTLECASFLASGYRSTIEGGYDFEAGTYAGQQSRRLAVGKNG
jgi:hypothetical protein